ASQKASAPASATRVAYGDGFSTTRLPPASAAATPPRGIASGKFQGEKTARAPRGAKRWSGSTSPSRARAYQLTRSTASDTSGSPSAGGFATSSAMSATSAPRRRRSPWAAASSTRRRSAYGRDAQPPGSSAARSTAASASSRGTDSGAGPGRAS